MRFISCSDPDGPWLQVRRYGDDLCLGHSAFLGEIQCASQSIALSICGIFGSLEVRPGRIAVYDFDDGSLDDVISAGR